MDGKYNVQGLEYAQRLHNNSPTARTLTHSLDQLLKQKVFTPQQLLACAWLAIREEAHSNPDAEGHEFLMKRFLEAVTPSLKNLSEEKEI